MLRLWRETSLVARHARPLTSLSAGTLAFVVSAGALREEPDEHSPMARLVNLSKAKAANDCTYVWVDMIYSSLLRGRSPLT